MKCRREGVIIMMIMLYSKIWKNEVTPKRWRGVVANLLKKGDKAG